MLDIFKNMFSKRSYKSLTKEHGWRAPSTSTANNTLLPHLRSLQDQSSDLVKNEAIGSTIINTLTDGVIGPGLRPNSSPDYETLGITEKQARDWGQKAEKLFSLWASTNDCSISRDMNFNQIESLVFRSTLEFGDCLVVRREQKDSSFPLCIQAIEGRRLATPLEKTDDNNVKEGVLLSKSSGEALSYFIKNNEDYFSEDTFKKINKRDRVGNSQAYLIKNVKRLAQTRGLPILSLVSPLIKVLGRYIQGELDISALSSYVSFVTRSSDGSSVLPDYGVVGVDNKRDPLPTSIKANSVVNLAAGESLELLDPKRPNSSFQSFVDHIVSLISSEVGIPGEVLLKKFDSSYSASRAAILQAHKTYKLKRKWIEGEFHSNVWEWFICSCVDQGYLKAPGFENKLVKQSYLNCSWTGEGCLQIDPAKEADGYQKLYDLGVTSKDAICKSLGVDFESVSSQLEKEKSNDNKTS